MLLNVGRTFPEASFRALGRQGMPQFRTTLHRHRKSERDRKKREIKERERRQRKRIKGNR